MTIYKKKNHNNKIKLYINYILHSDIGHNFLWSVFMLLKMKQETIGLKKKTLKPFSCSYVKCPQGYVDLCFHFRKWFTSVNFSDHCLISLNNSTYHFMDVIMIGAQHIIIGVEPIKSFKFCKIGQLNLREKY